MNQREFEKTVEEARIEAQRLIQQAQIAFLGKRANRFEEIEEDGETEGTEITA